MENLWTFLVRHFHWLLFLVLEAASLTLLFGHNDYQGSVWLTSANSLTGKVYEAQEWVENFFSLIRQNEDLAERNVRLEHQLDLLREKQGDAVADSSRYSLETLRQVSDLKAVAAKVVANTVNKPDNLITINKGRADGIKADMGVVSGKGVVGVVYLAGEHYSVVLPLLNRRSHISCSIRGRGYFGYLNWSPGDPARAYVDDIPRHAKFKLGDYIETSGYSAIFPHGVTVGRVEHVYNSPDGLSYRLQIRLATDFGNLRDVFVVDNSALQEQQQIMLAAQDSLNVTNNHK